MEVVALIKPVTPDHGTEDGELRQLSGTGDSYQAARDAIEIPEGWRLIGWMVPEHMDRLIG